MGDQAKVSPEERKESQGKIFVSGLKDGFMICLGYLAVSFAFGIQAVGSSLTVLRPLYPF